MEKILKRINYNSPIILSIVLLSFIAFIFNFITSGWSNSIFFSLYRGSALDPLFYVRLIGYTLGHLDFSHFLNNALFILLLGPILEEKYGSKKLLIMILVTAIATAIIHLAISNSIMLGSSGIVFMFILLCSYANYQEGKIPLTLVLVVVGYLGKEILAGIFYEDNVSQLAHICGGICGGIFGFLSTKNHI